jgi:hypothetical protein
VAKAPLPAKRALEDPDAREGPAKVPPTVESLYEIDKELTARSKE